MYAELFILRLSENCKNAAGNSYIYEMTESVHNRDREFYDRGYI